MKRLQAHLDETKAEARRGKRRPALGVTGWMAKKLFGEDIASGTDSAHHAPARQATPPNTLTPRNMRPSTYQEASEVAETTPGIKALLAAKTGAERREIAKRYPELWPPPRFFSDLVIEMLTLLYWEGLSYEETASRVGLSASQVQKMAPRQLRYLALFAQRPDFSDASAAYSRGDTRRDRFTMASTGAERRFTAQRYPELKALLNRFGTYDAWILHELYWEGKTYREVGEALGNRVKGIQHRADRALWKLTRLAESIDELQHKAPRSFFPLEKSPGHLTDDYLNAVLLTLKATHTLDQAAMQVGVTTGELKAYMDQMGIEANTVYEVSRDEV